MGRKTGLRNRGKKMNQGLDLLGGATYTNEVAKFAKSYAIGIFAEAFGDGFKTAEEALKAGCKILRVQLIWSDSHSFGDKDIKKIKKLAKKYNELANKYPATDVRLSPFCEHNISNPDKYLDITQQAAPSCLIVNTPWKGGFSKRYINEIHGDHAKPQGRYHYSFDGTEVTNEDVESYKKKYGDAEVFFMWTSRFNLRWSEKDKTSRPQRIKESKVRKPSSEFIESIAYLFTDKGVTQIPKGTIIKSHAERHQAVDAKGDKLLIIYPKKTNSLILKRNGKEVGKLNYYGSFDGGGFRYYAPKMGFNYGANLDVYDGKNKVGVINGGFRDGKFR